jgi:hypothetical protein
MGLFSGWLDGQADRYFGKDAGGRLAFFPFGWRKAGYYIEASDENKIKALLTVYFLAAALLNLVGSTASIAVTDGLVIGDSGRSLAGKLEFGLIVYAISAAFFYALPGLLLWKVYRGFLARVCSSLATVGAESIRPLKPSSNQRRAVALIVLTAVLLATIGMLLLVHRR